ncbi:MAG: hypothetical protein ACJ8EK_05155, partial [Bradyrhizobium sp.]
MREAIQGHIRKKDGALRRFAPRDDGREVVRSIGRHCERSEAIHGATKTLDHRFVAFAHGDDGREVV